MTPKLAAATAALVLTIGLVGGADARARHKNRHVGNHHAAPSPQTDLPVEEEAYFQPRRAPIPYAYSFYPQEIEDGVSGNLPFNNQIRKFKDPLNANGGGG